MAKKRMPEREHAQSRYMCVTVGLIEGLQQAFLDGQDLGQVVTDIDADTAAVIVAESLEADRVWNLPAERLLSDVKKGPMSDFKHAALAEIAFSIEAAAREIKNEEQADTWWAAAMASLEETLHSPTASPILWYEDIFIDLAQTMRGDTPKDERKAMNWLKQGLAHNLKFNDGGYAVSILRDMAERYLVEGKLDRGLNMLAAVLRHAPADIWTYNIMAISFDSYGLTELGSEAARRGLELLDAQGDPEALREQLENCLARMETSERQGREAEVAPETLADLRAALALDFDAGTPRPLGVLSRELVPDLDDMPTKRPMRPSDVPLPDRDALRPRQTRSPAEQPGRNDPCWCGSGKKYKHCHLRQDRKR
jgi:hypothetical protein